jgi:spermidine synthase
MLAMGLVNLTAGAIFLVLGIRGRAVADLGAGAQAAPRLEGFSSYAAVALLLGFAMMAIQTTLIRLGGLTFGSSLFTFSMVVAVFVLCIAMGSFAVSALPRIRPSYLVINQWLLVALLYFLYGRLTDAPYWAHVLRSLLRDTDAAFYPYYFAAFGGMLAAFGLPVMLSGAALPLLFHHLRRQVGELGAVAGRLYSWNTVGSLLGALLGGYALLFWLDLHQVYRIAVGAVAVSAAILVARVCEVSRLVATIVFLLPVLAALLLLDPWDPRRMSSGLFRERHAFAITYTGPGHFLERFLKNMRVLFYDDDPTATVAVTQRVSPDGAMSRSILTNGKSDGSTREDYPTMALAAVVPSLFAERVERAFVIGYGTGVTAGELAKLRSLREVSVAEISEGVVRAAPLFDFANFGASRHPKVRIVRSDAYRALLRSGGSYDVIVSEPSNPWMTGVEMLYSREFLEAARSRLTPKGVYAQWFHQYETDAETVALVLRTYAAVFEHVAVWFTVRSDLLLLGFRDGAAALDLDRLERRAARPEFAAALRRSGVGSFPALLAHELLPVGVLHAAELQGPVHTLFHPRLNHQAGRAFFRGGAGRLPFTGFGAPARVGSRNSLLRRYAARFQEGLPNEVRSQVVEAVCSERRWQCAALLADWRRRDPDSPALRRLSGEAAGRRLFGGAVSSRSVAALTRLFPGAGGEGEGVVALREAERANDLFASYYHHAAPFDPERLFELWRRCRDDEKASRACADGMREARSVLAGQAPEPDPALGRAPDGAARAPRRGPDVGE